MKTVRRLLYRDIAAMTALRREHRSGGAGAGPGSLRLQLGAQTWPLAARAPAADRRDSTHRPDPVVGTGHRALVGWQPDSKRGDGQ